MTLHTLLPRRVVLVEELQRLFGVPAVAVAPLGLYLGHAVADDAVAPLEDRAVGADLIEARPDGGRFLVGDGRPLEAAGHRGVATLNPADARDLRDAEPRDGRLDRLGDARVRALDVHQEACNADALARGERNRLELSRGRGREGDLVVLCAPGGLLSLDDDLSFEDALDTALDRLFSFGAPRLVHKGVGRLSARDVAEQFEDADHRVVVVGDVRVVALAEWEVLRPAAVLVLRREQIVETF